MFMGYSIAVFLRRKPGCSPLESIDPKTRPSDVLVVDNLLAVGGRDVVSAAVARNLEDFPEESVGLLLARAYRSEK